MIDEADQGPAALRAVRRVAIAEGRSPSADAASVAGALHGICAPVCAGVRQSLGTDGCAALLGRVFARTQWKHPAVRTIRGSTDSDIALAALHSAIEAHGSAATSSAVEAVLSSLHEILGRLIGEDMSKRIIDSDAGTSADGEAGS